MRVGWTLLDKINTKDNYYKYDNFLVGKSASELKSNCQKYLIAAMQHFFCAAFFFDPLK